MQLRETRKMENGRKVIGQNEDTTFITRDWKTMGIFQKRPKIRILRYRKHTISQV